MEQMENSCNKSALRPGKSNIKALKFKFEILRDIYLKTPQTWWDFHSYMHTIFHHQMILSFFNSKISLRFKPIPYYHSNSVLDRSKNKFCWTLHVCTGCSRIECAKVDIALDKKCKENNSIILFAINASESYSKHSDWLNLFSWLKNFKNGRRTQSLIKIIKVTKN